MEGVRPNPTFISHVFFSRAAVNFTRKITEVFKDAMVQYRSRTGQSLSATIKFESDQDPKMEKIKDIFDKNLGIEWTPGPDNTWVKCTIENANQILALAHSSPVKVAFVDYYKAARFLSRRMTPETIQALNRVDTEGSDNWIFVETERKIQFAYRMKVDDPGLPSESITVNLPDSLKSLGVEIDLNRRNVPKEHCNVVLSITDPYKIAHLSNRFYYDFTPLDPIFSWTETITVLLPEFVELGRSIVSGEKDLILPRILIDDEKGTFAIEVPARLYQQGFCESFLEHICQIDISEKNIENLMKRENFEIDGIFFEKVGHGTTSDDKAVAAIMRMRLTKIQRLMFNSRPPAKKLIIQAPSKNSFLNKFLSFFYNIGSLCWRFLRMLFRLKDS